MSLVAQAERFAREAHAQQTRKGGRGVPYFSHLESVARRLQRAGHDDPATLAAAYLHDVIEDQPAHEARLRAEFPPEVVAAVILLTEQKLDEAGHKRPKAQRFEAYAAGLRGDSPDHARAAAVSCADKIDNARSLVDDELSGAGLLLQLSTRPGQHRRQFETLRPIYAPHASAALLAEFDQAVAALENYLTRWLPGRAVAIAAAAHLGQFDRAGEPYILHPLRLMSRASSHDERIVAVLHDVVEDTPWTLEKLADEGFPAHIVAALDALTKRHGEGYDAFLDRVLRDPLASRVKRLDLEDNLNAARLPSFGPKDAERIDKYINAYRRLLAALDAGAVAGGDAEKVRGGR